MGTWMPGLKSSCFHVTCCSQAFFICVPFDSWRDSNPNIVKFWWDIDKCVKQTVSQRITTKTHGLTFSYESGFLFIELPSGRRLAYVKPQIGENRFGGESVTYMGVSTTKKWERIESYGPKFAENIVQAIEITDENVFCLCPKCGDEVQVDITEVLKDGDL